MTKTDSLQRFLYPVASITEGTRIRQDYGDVRALADSIAEHGLIHPIVINASGVLIAGGRRFRAMRDLLKWTEVPVTYFEFADEATLRILEREENVRRKQMSWQEEVLSIAEVHNHHQINAALGGHSKWTQRATGELLGQSEAAISYALTMASLIRAKDKDILSAPRMWDAIQIIVKRQTEASNALVAKLTIPTTSPADAQRFLDSIGDSADDSIYSTPTGPSAGGVGSLTDDGEIPGAPVDAITIPLSRMLLHGDSLDILSRLPAESVDHVITDWPYGIDMDYLNQNNPHGTLNNVDLVRAEHDVSSNESLHAKIIPLIYRILRPGGFFVTFTDYMQWQRNYDLLINSSFKVQRWPIIWHKTGRCMNQSALVNFTKNHEPAIVARKDGNLLTPQASSVWAGDAAIEVSALGHPFAKPYKLWEWLYSAICQRGQTVLDPFAGRGSSTIAALNYGLSPVAIETNDAHYSALVVNVSNHYQSTLKNVIFT